MESKNSITFISRIGTCLNAKIHFIYVQIFVKCSSNKMEICWFNRYGNHTLFLTEYINLIPMYSVWCIFNFNTGKNCNEILNYSMEKLWSMFTLFLSRCLYAIIFFNHKQIFEYEYYNTRCLLYSILHDKKRFINLKRIF